MSSLVHATTGSGSGRFSSVVDGALGVGDAGLNHVDAAVVDADSSTGFDATSSAAAAAAAAQWFAAAGGHHPAAAQYGAGAAGAAAYSPSEFSYMQRLHASIAAERRHCFAGGLADSDSDATTVHAPFGDGGYPATWYGSVQSPDVGGSTGYVGGSGSAPGLHDVFDVSAVAASRMMLSSRQSCAQLQSASPFRTYYGSGGSVIGPGPPAYAAYADDCASAKY